MLMMPFWAVIILVIQKVKSLAGSCIFFTLMMSQHENDKDMFSNTDETIYDPPPPYSFTVQVPPTVRLYIGRLGIADNLLILSL